MIPCQSKVEVAPNDNQENESTSHTLSTQRPILALAAIFFGAIQQATVSFAQTPDPGDATHNGTLLKAHFGTNHDQTVPEFWEYAEDYVKSHPVTSPPTIPGPIDRAFGAFTVKNENDTDGDGIVDKDDNDVIAVGQNDRDEVDLIKFEIGGVTFVL